MTSRDVREELRNRREPWLLVAAVPERMSVSYGSLDFGDGLDLCRGVDPVQEVKIVLVSVLDLPHVEERVDVSTIVALRVSEPS